MRGLVLVVLVVALATAQNTTTTAATTTAATTTAAATTTSLPSTTTTPPPPPVVTTVPGAPWTGEEAARARRFAKNDVALAVVELVRVTGSGNATVVTVLASAPFLVQADRMAQLSLPGSWAQFGGASDVQVAVSLWWNKTGPGNFTVTRTAPAPYAYGGLSVAFFEAWIGINGGAPEVLSWQTQCNGATVSGLPADQCAPAACLSAFCGLSTASRCNSTTNSSAAAASPCDARVYLAWRGPDAANQLCTSFSLLPANFALFSSASILSVFTGSFNDFVYGLLNGGARAGLSLATGLLLLAFCAA